MSSSEFLTGLVDFNLGLFEGIIRILPAAQRKAARSTGARIACELSDALKAASAKLASMEECAAADGAAPGGPVKVDIE